MGSNSRGIRDGEGTSSGLRKLEDDDDDDYQQVLSNGFIADPMVQLPPRGPRASSQPLPPPPLVGQQVR